MVGSIGGIWEAHPIQSIILHNFPHRANETRSGGVNVRTSRTRRTRRVPLRFGRDMWASELEVAGDLLTVRTVGEGWADMAIMTTAHSLLHSLQLYSPLRSSTPIAPAQRNQQCSRAPTLARPESSLPNCRARMIITEKPKHAHQQLFHPPP